METEILFSSQVKFKDRFINSFRWSLIYTPILIFLLIIVPLNFNNLYLNLPYLIFFISLMITLYSSFQMGKYYIQEIKIQENRICLKILKFNRIHINEIYDLDKIKLSKKAIDSKYTSYKLHISYLDKIIVTQFPISDWDEKMMDTVIYNFNEKVKNRING
jgi:hypothetical protein